MGDAFLGGAERAVVWADVVPFPGEEVFELVDSGVGAAFGGDAKKAQSSIIIWGGGRMAEVAHLVSTQKVHRLGG